MVLLLAVCLLWPPGLALAHTAHAPAVSPRVPCRALQDAEALQRQLRSGWVPRVGQTVFVPRLAKRAKVVALDGAGLLTLQAGLLKVTATVDEVRQQ